MINQDIMTIIILIAMSILDYYLFRGKDSNDFIATVKLYIIGFIIFITLITGYTFFIGLFVTVNIANWPLYILNWAIIFVVICVALYIKDKIKTKEAEKYLPDADTNEGKLAMLKTLHEKGVLTQAEFDEKSADLTVDA
jgi:predicted neutral ceramidase superfamily lipid hydrolase